MTYFGTRLSDNLSRREPEGYLICLNVPVARTGTQEYLPEELGLAPGGGPVSVYRPEEEVFAPACTASFEGMPVTDDHPAFSEGVNAENIRYLQKGHAHNIRRGTGKEADLLLADLIITDPVLIEEILNGKREISCGYTYSLREEGGRYVQREIRGNHIAVVNAGRAGPRVSIRDHAARHSHFHDYGRPKMERRKRKMKRSTDGVQKRMRRRESYAKRTARLMAMMARDGEAEELAEMIAEIVSPEESVAEAGESLAVTEEGPAEEIAEAVEEVLEAAETSGDTEEPVAVAIPEGREVTIDCGEQIVSLLQQILALLQPAADCGSSPSRDEDPVEPMAEVIAAAVTEGMAPSEEDPVETLVAEVVEEALEADPAEAAAGIGEAVEAALTGGESLDEDPASGMIEAESAEERARTADTLRAALAAFRPVLKTMAPAARRQAVRKIADSIRAGEKKTGGTDSYALLRGAARQGGRGGSGSADAALGKRIMEKRNANMRKAR